MLEAIRKFNDHPQEHTGPLSRAYFSLKRLRRIRCGPYYRLLARIHRQLKPRTYVEIGVSCGDAIVLCQGADICIGIDPDPNIRVVLPTPARIHRITSDAFFADDNLTAQLRKSPIDLAFIDGMHLFEFALRDFVNLEHYCGRQATILVHDCHPMDRASAARKRTTVLWTGDVWKLIVCLKKYRPDLQVRTVDVAPSGLAIIRGLDPASTVLSSRMREIEKEFIPQDFDQIETGLAQKLNLVPNHWNEIKAFLSDGSWLRTTD